MTSSENKPQLDNARLVNFCEEVGIRKHFSTPNHLQANGQVETINKIIKHMLKVRLDALKGEWADKLPNVLWSYRTTTKTSKGETPFSLAFGVEAMIPVELIIPSFRITTYNEEENQIVLRRELDLVEERRNGTKLRNVVYKQPMQDTIIKKCENKNSK